jgi:hypothetical protein
MAVPTKGNIDTYANVAAISVTETGANTLTFSKFAFPFSIMDKMALLIARVEYMPGSFGNMDGSKDNILMGLACAGSLADATNQADPLILDSGARMRIDTGVAASGFIYDTRIMHDFSTLPGGGLLVAPNPLYAFMKGTGNTAANNMWVRLFYTYMQLATDDYWQLVESRRVITS